MTLLTAIRQFLCGLHGHDVLPQFDPNRMYLRCVSCGHESPGWALDGPTPAPIRPKVVRFRKRMAA